MHTLAVQTKAHTEAVNITDELHRQILVAKVRNGWCELFVQHTTAAICINEAADPSVMQDVLESLESQVPWQAGYKHAEGNSAAHIKSILVGPSLRIPIMNGRMALGTWQGIFFMEFDGPRQRRVLMTLTEI
jgi:secondary thiamine-phosphate synthase enzyme